MPSLCHLSCPSGNRSFFPQVIIQFDSTGVLEAPVLALARGGGSGGEGNGNPLGRMWRGGVVEGLGLGGGAGGLSGKETSCSAGEEGKGVLSLSQADPLEEGLATHSSILAWRIPCTEEPSRLQSLSQKVPRD